MTDPSLYQFSDAFLNALQNAQEQPIQDDSYYPDDTQQPTQPDDSADYQSMYEDLNQKYEDQSTLLQQLQDQFQQFSSQPQYQESPYAEGDPNYAMDFISRNVLGLQSSNSSSSKFQVFSTPEEGRNALIHQLDLYQTGRTRNPVKPSSTLEEAMGVYAPASDNNDPHGYAAFIANKIGVSPNTPISDIDVNKWADAITQFEGNKTGNNPGNLETY